MKKYTYINNLGIRKFLYVNENEDGSLDCSLWSDQGDFCGKGQMTQEELSKYLEHYNVDASLDTNY